MARSASATNVGKGGAGGAPPTSRTGGQLQKRGTRGAGTRTQRAPAAASVSAGNAGMWRFYTEDSRGLTVGPVPVLVMSLLFIASVFMLHIWGKVARG